MPGECGKSLWNDSRRMEERESQVKYHCEIPANTEATIFTCRMEPRKELGSGVYEFYFKDAESINKGEM